MAVKFGIRNYSRNGNQVTFTVVALNADGSIDTSYAGNVTFGVNNMSDPGAYTFVAGDQGQRVFTTTIADPNFRAGMAAVFPGGSTGANISVSGPNGTNVSFGNTGDHLIVGGIGNDIFGGNNGDDLFLVQQGGNENINGGAGNDGFYFGATYTVDDIVNGGAGNRDQVGLQGHYITGVTLGSLLGVETVVLLPASDNRFDGGGGAFSYRITANGSTQVSNNKLTIQANTLRVGEEFIFDGSATAIDFLIYGGLGTDYLTGGSGNDGFFFGQGRFGSGEIVNGGAGSMDQIGFQGNFTGGNTISFGASQISGIEAIVLLSANDNRFGASGGTVSYTIVMDDGNVAAGERMLISANTLQTGERLIFIGPAETNGSFLIYSGAGNDFIEGGALADEIWGGGGSDGLYGYGGADVLRGGAGADQFRYAWTSDSTAAAPDQILDFATGDKIFLLDLIANTGGGDFTFIGSGAPTGARQVQVIQSGDQATVNLYLDSDATADMVIDVTVVDGHMLTIGDFTGVSAMQQLQQPAHGLESIFGGARFTLWKQDESGALLDQWDDPTLIGAPNALHALPPTSDLLL